MATFNLNADALKEYYDNSLDNFRESHIDMLTALKVMRNCKDSDIALHYLTQSQKEDALEVLNYTSVYGVIDFWSEYNNKSDELGQLAGTYIRDTYDYDKLSKEEYKIINDFLYEEFDKPELEKYQDIYKKEGLDVTVKQIMKDNNNEDPGWIVFYKDELFPDKAVNEIEKSINKFDKPELQ